MIKNPKQQPKPKLNSSIGDIFKNNKLRFLIATFIALQIHKYTHPVHYYRPEVLARNRLEALKK